MQPTDMSRRLGEARVARLATAGPLGRPHLVPICFALDGDTMFFAVDAKPKRTSELQRLKNIAANPHVCVLVDHYEEDWTRLWWIRLDGTARILSSDPDLGHALDLLAERYAQYRERRPGGPVVAISIDRVTGWEGG